MPLTIPNQFGNLTTAQASNLDADFTTVANYINARNPTTGLLAARPAFGNAGAIYFATDQGSGVLYLDTGTAWVAIGAGGFGAWTTPAYNAANFTGNGAMTWTVDAGDVTTYAYTLVGKTMTVAVDLVSTSVAGTPNSQLQVAIPASAVAAKTMIAPAVYNDNGGTRTIGLAFVVASGTTIAVQTITAANWTASTNNTTVQFTITIEVQ